MEVFETPTINQRVWAALSGEHVNGWSIADNREQSCLVVVQYRVLASFAYTNPDTAKREAWQKARDFAANNNLVRLLAPNVETTFLASRDLFLYSRQYGGSGVAFGNAAHLASAKVHNKDNSWLERLVDAIGVHTGSVQLNQHQVFQAFQSN